MADYNRDAEMQGKQREASSIAGGRRPALYAATSTKQLNRRNRVPEFPFSFCNRLVTYIRPPLNARFGCPPLARFACLWADPTFMLLMPRICVIITKTERGLKPLPADERSGQANEDV
jgi:hypothetical protein